MVDSTDPIFDELDRRIVKETQGGLPLVPQPYEEIARRLGCSANEVMSRMQKMQERGAIRRIGAVPNHYTLGFRGNGMTVWDLPDDKVEEYGEKIGSLDFVSHAYQRPRHQPQWNYNLFAMVHGKDRDEVMEKVKIIIELLGGHNRGHEVLFSSKILKKTGMRF
ncbi:MAG: AsnC family transcriptional regulator [Sedimenticola sp.]